MPPAPHGPTLPSPHPCGAAPGGSPLCSKADIGAGRVDSRYQAVTEVYGRN